MKQFFKYFFASGLAIIVFGLILLFITIGVFSAKFNSGPDPVEVKQSSVLRLKFDKPVGERSFAQIKKEAMNIQVVEKIGVKSIITDIEFAKTDDKIKGIYLDLSSLHMGMATMEEIRNALIDFKESEKFIISYSEMYSQGAYYLASVSDEIYLYPTGTLIWKGLVSEKTFLKNMMDNLEIDMQVIRGSNNKFKSAVEPFMYNQMSDANREQTMTYLNALWNQMLTGISDTRGISKAELNEIADSVYVRSAETAKEYKLVDDLIYEDELYAQLKEKVEIGEDDDLSLLSFQKYCKKAVKKQKLDLLDKDKNIAVIYAVGGIESGKGAATTIGSETIAKAIRDAHNDENIKAIVLRVNSPGGSALASDVIWREMVLAKAKMPVVVSMGDVAASGGYYIACESDRIFAQPNTITGSIGVFGVLPNVSKPLEEKLGITVDRAYTNRPSMMTITRALTAEEYSIIQEGVDDIYMDFKQKVANGRPELDIAGVDAIGQGRVWAGTDAVKNGLVDELGGIDEAIAYAKEKAGLDEAVIDVYPKKKEDKLMEVLEQFDIESSVTVMSPAVQKLNNYLKAVEKATKIEGVQARLPFEINVK